MMKPILALAMFAAGTSPALAQDQTPPADKPVAEKFAKHDTDKNGSLSLAEVQVADGAVTSADFDAYDADKDKALSEDEFGKWLEAKATPPASAPGE